MRGRRVGRLVECFKELFDAGVDRCGGRILRCVRVRHIRSRRVESDTTYMNRMIVCEKSVSMFRVFAVVIEVLERIGHLPYPSTCGDPSARRRAGEVGLSGTVLSAT